MTAATKIGTRSIPEIDRGHLPIWKLDELGIKELAWQDMGLLRHNWPRLRKSVLGTLRLTFQVGELFRKFYPDSIKPGLTPQMLQEAGVISNLSLFESIDQATPTADTFARQGTADTLCHTCLTSAARNKSGEEKLKLLRLGFDIDEWPDCLPELKLKETDLDDANEVIGKMYDSILKNDFLLGFSYKDVQRALAKKWPWDMCGDCRVRLGCECGEIKFREKTGHLPAEIEVDKWQAEEQSLFGLAVQMQDQYHPKNLARGVFYELHRAMTEFAEFADKVLDKNHEVRKDLDLQSVMKESTDERIWLTVVSLPFRLNLHAFLKKRYERMKQKREEEQRSSPWTWTWDGSVWSNA